MPMGQKAAVLSLPDQIQGLRPPFHPNSEDLTMHSPYLGWIVPYEWQESPEWLDGEPESDDYPDDCDSEGYLIDTN